MDADQLARSLREALPGKVDFASLRFVDERTEVLSVRKGVLEPVTRGRDVGVMITVHHAGGAGYAATSDLSSSGLAQAARRAVLWAEATRGRMAFDLDRIAMPSPRGRYESPVERPWSQVPIATRLDRLRAIDATLPISASLVDWTTSVMAVDTDIIYVTADGGAATQTLRHVSPEVEVVAHANGDTQRRTLGGLRGASQQGGEEVLDRYDLEAAARRVAREALELVSAPNCPTGTMDVVLAADQMMLQIHESIGHPLELDRILGDERNYAGTSFVTLDMFGTYQYGSDLLNVTFAPDIDIQLASYGFDDEGAQATRQYVIRRGVLVRPLGGTLSQARAGMPGVANARATSWNRPAIDRMANLNVEPGDRPLSALIGAVERGVYMETNLSWSIDDSRNKFQFGCEYAREIVNGALGRVVRNPNYRGISESFWRSLGGVGDASTVQILGTPYCGKGEPNQIVRVGHASPACLFRDVAVFGGDA